MRYIILNTNQGLTLEECDQWLLAKIPPEKKKLVTCEINAAGESIYYFNMPTTAHHFRIEQFTLYWGQQWIGTISECNTSNDKGVYFNHRYAKKAFEKYLELFPEAAQTESAAGKTNSLFASGANATDSQEAQKLAPQPRANAS